MSEYPLFPLPDAIKARKAGTVRATYEYKKGSYCCEIFPRSFLQTFAKRLNDERSENQPGQQETKPLPCRTGEQSLQCVEQGINAKRFTRLAKQAKNQESDQRKYLNLAKWDRRADTLRRQKIESQEYETQDCRQEQAEYGKLTLAAGMPDIQATNVPPDHRFRK